MAFPGTYLGVAVEIALGADLTADPSTWDWTDVTAYVRARDGISITRGGYDGALQAPPSRCAFTVDNRDGRWVPTNPSGAWYGQLRKNTPVRVVVDEGTPSVRWTGFLSSLPPRWNDKETDRYVLVTASGILQRLQRGSTPLRSTVVRTIAGTETPPVAYWPGEDASAATSIAEYFGGRAMTYVGGLTPASSGPDGSRPLPQFATTAGVTGLVPPHTSTGQWSVSMVFKFPADPGDQATLVQWYTGGNPTRWAVELDDTPDVIALRAYDTTGAQVLDSTLDFTDDDGTSLAARWLMVVAHAAQVGTLTFWGWDLFDGVNYTGGNNGSLTGTVGIVSRVTVPPSARINGMHAGHWAVWDDVVDALSERDGFNAMDPACLVGYTGETAAHRAERLALEEFNFTALSADTCENTMGPQTEQSFLELLRECEAVAGGRLVEAADPSTGGTYLLLRTADGVSNQDALMTLNHDSGHLSLPFEPTDDDQQLRNDWTVTRTGASGSGSTARAVDEASVAEHGTHDDSIALNVEKDEDLVHQAGWRVHL